MLTATKDRDIVSSAAVDFLMYSGYVMHGVLLGADGRRRASRSSPRAAHETPEFYKAKIQTAEFYFEKLLPRTKGHAESMLSPTKTRDADGRSSTSRSFDFSWPLRRGSAAGRRSRESRQGHAKGRERSWGSDSRGAQGAQRRRAAQTHALVR